jgi:nickel-dependent lactate racemase
MVLRHLREGGISVNTVRILLSAGTHSAPHSDSVLKKVGAEAASACQILIHDAKRSSVTIGRTSSGTPVAVDKAVLASDFVVGVGGVYPNHTAGYGGGSKLALGVLGFRTIKSLHFRYRPIGWGRWEASSPFRTDLDEIAKMIQFKTMISLQINADREIIRATCGDHFLFQNDEVAFAQHYFRAPSPEEADVVISNAYPNDLSVTAAIQKGTAPLRRTHSGASRILIASCAGGTGHHGLFPVMNQPPCLRALQIGRHVSVMKPGELARAVVRRIRRGPRPRDTTASKPIWFYRPGDQTPGVNWNIPGYRLLDSWSDVLLAVEREQGTGKQLKVFCYPCAPLQRLGW